jgi:hypothetical protein
MLILLLGFAHFFATACTVAHNSLALSAAQVAPCKWSALWQQGAPNHHA